MRWRVSVLVLVLALAAGFAAWRVAGGTLPRAHDPWAPLDLAAPPNWLTAWKLDRTRRDPAACQAAAATLAASLAGSGSIEPLPDRQTGEGCGFEGAWRVAGLPGIAVGEPLRLSCPMLLSLAMWERHGLQPAAQRHFGQPVTRLRHAGSYACRNLYHRPTGPRSRHATADALDVTGVVLADGATVRLLRDWDTDTPAGAFLEDAHRSACRWFDGVLGPGYNAAHRDHFHLEAGGWRACR